MRRTTATRYTRRSRFGNTHPLFPRVVVYLTKRADLGRRRDKRGFVIEIKTKDDYSAPWVTKIHSEIHSGTPAAARKARATAHSLGNTIAQTIGAPQGPEFVS